MILKTKFKPKKIINTRPNDIFIYKTRRKLSPLFRVASATKRGLAV
jgi:hypothetical protein